MKLAFKDILMNPMERLSSLPVVRSRAGGEMQVELAKSRLRGRGVCSCSRLPQVRCNTEDPVKTAIAQLD